MEKVRIRYNASLNGIELFFNEEPGTQTRNDIVQNGFHWSYKMKKFYARRYSKTEGFIKEYFGKGINDVIKAGPEGLEAVPISREREISENGFQPVSENDAVPFLDSKGVQEGAAPVQTEISSTAELAEHKQVKTNVFASCFNKVGNDDIYKDAEVSLVDFRNSFHAGYFEKENVKVTITNGDAAIYIEDLSCAMTKEKCNVYKLSIDGEYFSSVNRSAVIYLINELKIHTVADLVKAVQTKDFNFGELNLNIIENSGVKMFSPFKEVTPLEKMPEIWSRSLIIKGLCSGQFYKAVCDYHCTEDYAHCAARNFDKGKEFSVALLAKEYIENWDGRKMSIQAGEIKDNACVVKVFDNYDSVDLYFDLNCDIEKGMEKRADLEMEKSLFNQIMEQTVIKPKDVIIKPDKFYDVTFLEMDANTGRYKELREMTQGISMIDFEEPDKFHWYYSRTTDVMEKTIVPGLFYTVSDFENPTIIDFNDRRFIPMGNFHVLVSGQTLLEKVQDGWRVPYVSAKVYCGNTFAAVKEELGEFIKGQTMWANDTSEIIVDYKDSLRRVCEEEDRLSRMKLVVDDNTKKTSLVERISKIENERKGESTGRSPESGEKAHPPYAR